MNIETLLSIHILLNVAIILKIAIIGVTCGLSPLQSCLSHL